MQSRPRTFLAPAVLAVACFAPPQEPENVTIIPPLRVTAMTGTVVDADGEPVAGATVQVSGIEVFRDGKWQREFRLGYLPYYTTDENGVFELEYSEKQRMRYDLWAVKHGYAPTFVSAVSATSGPPRIVLQYGVELRGSVTRLTPEGPVAVAGATVVVGRPTTDLWYVERVQTDHEGNYVARIPAGRGADWQVEFLGEHVALPAGAGDDRAPVAGPRFEVTLQVYD